MEFLQIVPMQEANVCSIIVADTGPDAVGTATSDSAVRCDVRIGPGQSEIVLKMVIAHEAVHCLGYGHTSLPNHIMNPHILPERYIIKHLDRLYKDLIEYVEWDL